ncbi:uncharacterized protein LOC134725242 [Mytilus trossulus]|uniref:uncharacterized protein LOC134725242 n=1 Tax=Mytilus trossulus TaxID=6551 RepID=UPI003004AAB2
MILKVYFLFVFAREVFSIELNRTTTVCENETAKLSCINNSNIKITSVQVGRLKEPYRIQTGSIDLLSLSDDNVTQTQHQLEGVCNEKQSCLINETSINFKHYQIPRTIDVSYRCEYEYVGCYIDNWSRAYHFQPRNPHHEMSTQICYQFCLKQNQFVTFFATENGNECYCGNGEKLGNGAYRASSGCNEACKNNQNRDEMCGGNWRLSVYDMNTGKQTVNGVLTKNKIDVKCSHHAGAKDISVTLQHSSVTCKSNGTSAKRKLSLSTNEVYTGRDYCYLLENSAEFRDDKSCYEPIFATLNYSCVENLATVIRDDTMNKGEQNGTGLIIGAIGGVSIIVIAALLLLALREKIQHKAAEQHPHDKLSNSGRSFSEGNDDNHLYANDKSPQQNMDVSNAENIIYLNYDENSVVFSRPTDDTCNTSLKGIQNQPADIKPVNPDTRVYCNYTSNIAGINHTSGGEITDNDAAQTEVEYEYTDRVMRKNYNVCNETKDGVYDVGSHVRSETKNEDTYDHFFGDTTEDDYDISCIKKM